MPSPRSLLCFLLFVPSLPAWMHAQLLTLFQWTEHGTVSRGAYYDMHKNIVQVLLPKTTTVEALSLAKADWERDSQGATELSREQAYDAVFQIVDIWTASLDIAECVRFAGLPRAHTTHTRLNCTCLDPATCVLHLL